MKTGLGIHRRLRRVFSYYALLRFSIYKHILGFDVANQFLQRVDKLSLQFILVKNGASVGVDCDIETGLVFHNCKDYSNLVIGDNCHVGKNCFFDLREKVVLGDNVVVSMKCTFITHIDMNKSPLKEKCPSSTAPLYIGSCTYIGVESTILMGVNIGKGCFIAARSLVNKNVIEHQRIRGVPAKEF